MGNRGRPRRARGSGRDALGDKEGLHSEGEVPDLLLRGPDLRMPPICVEGDGVRGIGASPSLNQFGGANLMWSAAIDCKKTDPHNLGIAGKGNLQWRAKGKAVVEPRHEVRSEIHREAGAAVVTNNDGLVPGERAGNDWKEVRGKRVGTVHGRSPERGGDLATHSRFALLDVPLHNDDSNLAAVVSQELVEIVAPLATLVHDPRGMELLGALDLMALIEGDGG
ncbi:hypothetical protein Dimus_032455 [Dionaea muscipula]